MLDSLTPFQLISTDKPSAARMYDYFLGGYHNFAIDREAADRALEICPGMRVAGRANRAFLGRAVRYCVDQGIDQFLDLGSGIPTAGNVHEIAEAMNPAARVVYVDIDPIATAQSRSLLRQNPNSIAIQADAAEISRILVEPEVRRLIDLDKPLAVLMVALLHFIPDDPTVSRIIRTVREAVVKGSYIAISHGLNENMSAETARQLEALYAKSTNRVRFRSRAEMNLLFEGLELVPPGVVEVFQWRPDGASAIDGPQEISSLCGVGRKP
jgi:hypothetical protein